MSLITTITRAVGVGVMAISATTTAATMSEFLVGTYTEGDSEGIYRFAFDSTSGQIDPQPLQVTTSENPSWLVMDETQRWLYAVNENGPGNPDPIGRVSSFAIDPQSHELSLLGQVSTLSDHPTHASLSPDGRYLFVSNYSVNEDPGGSLAVIPTGEDGHVQPVTQISTHQASRVNAKRQSSSHVHSAVVSPDGRFVFSSDLGADKVFIHRYDPKNTERPLSPAEPPFIALPAGSGPRHLAFSPDGKQAWLTLEMSAQVVRFDYADGTLKQRQLVDLIGESDSGKHSAAAVHPSPDGRFLYVSDRGEVNRILVFAIEADGTLREIQRRSSEGKEPREFSLDPSGNYLLVANQLSDNIVVMRRDPQTGKIGETVQTLPVSRPSAVKFFEVP